MLRFLKESMLDLQKQFDELDIEKEKEKEGENNLVYLLNLLFYLRSGIYNKKDNTSRQEN